MGASDAERRMIAVGYYDNIAKVRRGQVWISAVSIGVVWWFFPIWWVAVPVLFMLLAIRDGRRPHGKRDWLHAGIDPVPADIPQPGGRKPVRYIP